ncbi:MAG TPA: type II toxin-antitoxin system PemK/MazF family toxin, partial [Tepidisphaeraceae bacterium]|nr:type II toxin-antitoxin system PemK/MazF family toxin [Tepidisphaeraceae bacterium]
PGEIYFVDLYEAGRRPVVIVSRASLNRGGYAVAVPITSTHFERRSHLPNCVSFHASQFGFTKDCVAQCEAILTVEQSQMDTSPVGMLDESAMRDVIRAIGYVIESDCEPR